MPQDYRYFDVPGGQGGEVATLVEMADQRPIREVTTGRRGSRTGSYFSVKCGMAMPWESGNELRAIYEAEVRSDVVRYRMQPHTLQMGAGAAIHRYTPDIQLELSDGTAEIIEVKGQFDELADPVYAAKLKAARKVYRI